MTTKIDFEEKFMSGFQGEVVNFPDTEEEVRAQERAKADVDVLLSESMIGYTTCVPIHKNINLQKTKAHFALMPVWVYRYKFRGKDFIYHVNGQTGKVIGETPTDKKKSWLYSAAVAFMTGIMWQSICWILEVF